MIKLTQTWNDSINSTVWLCCPKRLFCGMHQFTISTCDVVLQFNDNLMTQFNEKKVYQGIRTVKYLSLKINKVTSKNVTITQKKEKQYVRQIIYHLGAFTYKSCPRYWLYRWTSSSMWCSSCEGYVCWWSQINDRNDKW